jgi:hypothetical protein
MSRIQNNALIVLMWAALFTLGYLAVPQIHEALLGQAQAETQTTLTVMLYDSTLIKTPLWVLSSEPMMYRQYSMIVDSVVNFLILGTMIGCAAAMVFSEERAFYVGLIGGAMIMGLGFLLMITLGSILMNTLAVVVGSWVISIPRHITEKYWKRPGSQFGFPEKHLEPFINSK